MKTRKSHLTRLSLLGLGSLALMLSATAINAEAAVRVSAAVRTPYGVVRVDTGAPRARCEMLPVRHLIAFRVTGEDRQMARRLASYTGVSRHEILELRRRGYRWDEIGSWLGLSRSVVRAAESSYTWHRFLDRDGRGSQCAMDNDHHRDNRYGDKHDNRHDGKGGERRARR